MSDQPSPEPSRILIIDDNAAIHSDFRKILGAPVAVRSQLDDVEKALFGEAAAPMERGGFRIDSAYQGQEALALVQHALQENDPYAMAFVDVRMPPGWDGIETLERLWKCAPDLQAVICTAYSDYSWDDITRRFGQTDSLLILKKPFDTVEVLQLAHALTKKWALARQARLRLEDLDRMVRERTRELQAEVEERTRVQEALRISEERFSKAFQASPMPMAMQNGAEGRFLDANASFLELTGYAADQLLQRTEAELQLWQEGAPPSAEGQPEGAQSASERRTPNAEFRVRNHPCLLRRRDHTTRNTLVWTEPITLNADPCRLLLVEDVTEHLRLEAQLRQAQKMEAIGCLSAGVAHEFNNLLTVIQGHADLLRGTLRGAGPEGRGAGPGAETRMAGESVERIAQASQRAASLTRQLLAFSRKQPLQLKPVQLSTTVQRLQKMLRQLIGEPYQLCLECAMPLPVIRADEGNMEQILINLVLNARDAMGHGGTIQIRTSALRLDEAAARLHPEARPGQFVCLTVTDTGCGMPPELLGRIFDPFFTTKEVGKGTGLGLSTVHGIVRQHQGWIQVTSQLGQGSSFQVFLPAWESAERGLQNAECREPSREERALPRGGGETVLLVEDESSVRRLARLALERGGYRVLEAADGPHALTVWEQAHGQIDLLVTDLVMPNGLSGGALARALLGKDPRLRTIYTSGYSSEVMDEDRSLLQGTHFLPKPYDSLSLLKAVQACLQETPGGDVAGASSSPSASGRPT